LTGHSLRKIYKRQAKILRKENQGIILQARMSLQSEKN
jgi:hypothetical protein